MKFTNLFQDEGLWNESGERKNVFETSVARCRKMKSPARCYKNPQKSPDFVT